MHVIFIHGPAASGKHTIGSELAVLTGLPLFHNHLAVDAAKTLFEFGTPGFNAVRAAVWRTAFSEAAAAGQSFIFTFHPEASVARSLVNEMIESVESRGGTVIFVELKCSPATILARLQENSRTRFGKLTDPALYQELEKKGAFDFPALPLAHVTVHTDEMPPRDAARAIHDAVRAFVGDDALKTIHRVGNR